MQIIEGRTCQVSFQDELLLYVTAVLGVILPGVVYFIYHKCHGCYLRYAKVNRLNFQEKIDMNKSLEERRRTVGRRGEEVRSCNCDFGKGR